MDEAARLARRASEHEDKNDWEAASKTHRQAAAAYRGVTTFDFDPVSALSLSTLANKHTRWAEFCELQGERQKAHIIPAEQNSSDGARDVSVDLAHKEDVASVPAATIKNSHEETNEHEFEDFWRYMQNWLANPAAYTQPAIPSSTRSDPVLSPSQGIMDSFYIVESSHQGSASLYIGNPEAGAPDALSRMADLGEHDQPVDSTTAKLGAESLAGIVHGKQNCDDSSRMVSLLQDENRQLKMLVKRLNEQIRTLESAAHENNMLKSSILNFREEFHRHANAVTHKISEPMDHRRSQAPVDGNSAASEELIRQLQMQLESLSMDNAKQKAQVTKYRERWEKLKESAKRKRMQQENQ